MSPLELIDLISSGALMNDFPKAIQLNDNDVLMCEKILRFLPNKRVVIKAKLNEVDVIAKFFTHQSQRSAMRERNVEQKLISLNSSLSFPKILHKNDYSKGGVLHIYEYINGRVANKDDDKEITQILCGLAEKGIFHKDPHWNNFIANEHGMWLLDYGSLEFENTLSNNKITEALSLWIAQYPLWEHEGISGQVLSVWKQYDKVDKWPLKQSNLVSSAKKIWNKRKNNYLKKIMRNCTEVEVHNESDVRWRIRREYKSNELLAFINSPEQYISKSNILKNGGATLVAQGKLGEKNIIIKRYNYRNSWQNIKIRLGMGRAAKNWWASHLLKFCQINTPDPVCMLESKVSGRWIGYVVTLAVQGQEYIDYVFEKSSDEIDFNSPAEFIKKLQACQIEHGDMKARNILINNNDELYLIDLDALCSRSFLWRWRKNKDVERFLKNWVNTPYLKEFEHGLSFIK